MKSVAEIFRSYGVLDAQGRHINGTDKETNHHYGAAYEGIIERYLSPNNALGWRREWVHGTLRGGVHKIPSRDRSQEMARNRVKLMMEIGIADGSSLLAWREVFPNALCVGLDIMPNPTMRLYGEDRIEFYCGDMRLLEDCRRVVHNRQFDFICEDATHVLGDTLQTLLYLWPHVRPGGLYVIEEFCNIGSLREHIKALWPFAQIVGTTGPSGGDEPLVVFRKPNVS